MNEKESPDKIPEAKATSSDPRICAVCGKLDCKKLNHTPPATDKQCMTARESGWW